MTFFENNTKAGGAVLINSEDGTGVAVAEVAGNSVSNNYKFNDHNVSTENDNKQHDKHADTTPLLERSNSTWDPEACAFFSQEGEEDCTSKNLKLSGEADTTAATTPSRREYDGEFEDEGTSKSVVSAVTLIAGYLGVKAGTAAYYNIKQGVAMTYILTAGFGIVGCGFGSVALIGRIQTIIQKKP